MVFNKHQFGGVAEMTSQVDFKAGPSSVWIGGKSRWRGRMRVRWVYVKDVPSRVLNKIKLENNENKPISFARDCHDVPTEKGVEFMKIFHSHQHETSVIDDKEKVEEILERSEFGDKGPTKNEILPKPVNRSNLKVM